MLGRYALTSCAVLLLRQIIVQLLHCLHVIIRGREYRHRPYHVGQLVQTVRDIQSNYTYAAQAK